MKPAPKATQAKKTTDRPLKWRKIQICYRFVTVPFQVPSALVSELQESGETPAESICHLAAWRTGTQEYIEHGIPAPDMWKRSIRRVKFGTAPKRWKDHDRVPIEVELPEFVWEQLQARAAAVGVAVDDWVTASFDYHVRVFGKHTEKGGLAK